MRFQTVVGGDTLTGIAQQVYGDASLFPLIAAANGIKDPNRIDVDQVLEIPDLRLDLPVKPFVAKFDGVQQGSFLAGTLLDRVPDNRLLVIEDVAARITSDRVFDALLTISAGLPPTSLDDDTRPPVRNYAIPFTQRRTTGDAGLFVGGRTVRWYVEAGERLDLSVTGDQDVVVASVGVTVSGHFVYA